MNMEGQWGKLVDPRLRIVLQKQRKHWLRQDQSLTQPLTQHVTPSGSSFPPHVYKEGRD